MSLKISLLLPLALVPLLSLIFYGMGGGKGLKNAAAQGDVQGINITLPPPKNNEKAKAPDKMTTYEKAAQDSALLLEKKKQDPYAFGKFNDSGKTNGLQTAINRQQQATDEIAGKVLERLTELRHTMAAPQKSWPSYSLKNLLSEAEPQQIRSDPEMSRIDGMLDKLIRIQHPIHDDQTTVLPHEHVALLESPQPVEYSAGFIDITEPERPDSTNPARDQAIEAVVDNDQTLTAGATVGLRLAREARIDSKEIPRGQLIYGVASLSGERLDIKINSIRVGTALVPVALQVYDLDGLPGIRIPGALSRDVSKESASEAMSSLGMASLDPSLSAQAANAGLQFAKSLASRKARLIRVALPAGYKVLLKNIKPK